MAERTWHRFPSIFKLNSHGRAPAVFTIACYVVLFHSLRKLYSAFDDAWSPSALCAARRAFMASNTRRIGFLWFSFEVWPDYVVGEQRSTGVQTLYAVIHTTTLLFLCIFLLYRRASHAAFQFPSYLGLSFILFRLHVPSWLWFGWISSKPRSLWKSLTPSTGWKITCGFSYQYATLALCESCPFLNDTIEAYVYTQSSSLAVLFARRTHSTHSLSSLSSLTIPELILLTNRLMKTTHPLNFFVVCTRPGSERAPSSVVPSSLSTA